MGPGLLESAYEECLCHELRLREFHFQRQKPLPVMFKEVTLDCGYRLDLPAVNSVVVEIKAVEAFLPIHEAHLFPRPARFGGWNLGLLINFNVKVLKEDIKRIVPGLRP